MRARTILYLLTFCSSMSPGWAQLPLGFGLQTGVNELASNIPGVGARALGMAGAFTAIADDATAATWNPAGLAHLSRPEASFIYETSHSDIDPHGGELAITDVDSFQSFSLIDENGEADYGRPTFLSATYPFQVGGRPFAIQLSARRLLEVPRIAEDRRFRFQSIDADGAASSLAFADSSRTSFSGGVELLSVSAAYERLENLRVGLTLNYLAADYTFRQAYGYVLSDGEVTVQQFSNTDVLKESFSDWFADVGVQWEITKKWGLGAVYHTGFTTDRAFSDTLTRTATGALFRGPSIAKGRGRVTWPDSYAIGLAFMPNDRLRVAADFSATSWSEAERDVFVSLDFDPIGIDDRGNVIFRPRQEEETDLPYPNFDPQKDTRALRLGGESLFFARGLVIPLRAGVFEEHAMLGAFPELNRDARTIRGFTLGSGLTYKRFVVDLAWVHSESKEDILSTDVDSITLVVDDYKIETDRLIASLIVRF